MPKTRTTIDFTPELFDWLESYVARRKESDPSYSRNKAVEEGLKLLKSKEESQMYERKLNKLNGQTVDPEFGITQNLYDVGITDEQIDRIHSKPIYTDKGHVTTQYFLQLDGDPSEYVLTVNEETKEIKF